MVKTSNPNNQSTPPFSPSSSSYTMDISQDQSSPYYIHPSKNPTSVLVTPVLIGNNYYSWSRSFTMAVISKNKYSFFTGTIPFSLSEDLLFPAWECCNNLVLSWLFHSLSPSITQSVIYLNTVASVWVDLKE
ncbi:uncharacterized protein DS421_17g577430 [Arachis hypogaea]|nr:uncharacterized protein DS421_17g577430 [Arachis hypogaea]